MIVVTDPRPLATSGDRDITAVLAAAASGDEDAWRCLVELYGRRVFALAKTRCGSIELAEEIAQSVFVTVATTLGRGGYAERGRFESWLFRIAMNRIRDEMRRRGRRMASGDCAGAEVALPADPPEPHRGDLESMRRALVALSDADREVIELRHHGGMSFGQMAAMLGEPVGTLLARHHRALRKLRAMMEESRDSIEGTRT